MNTVRFNELIPQIRRLLYRESEPIVTKKISKVSKNAGNGVFTSTTVVKGKALCLYPGVYCPGIPEGMVDSDANPYGDHIEFLGHHSTPSGIPIEKNAYILNIQSAVGGYIDGMALEIIEGQHVPIREDSYGQKLYHAQEKTRLDSNPSCCGHMINHSIRHQNVQVLPFLWSDVIEPVHNYLGYDHNLAQVYTKTKKTQPVPSLPNIMRQDGAPRYRFNGDVIHYATTGSNISSINNVYGAVIYATEQIGPEQELLLDYKLKKPLPLWAASWYDFAE